MMNTGLTINAAANTIEMTKEFARKAKYFGTDEYKLLQDASHEIIEKNPNTKNTIPQNVIVLEEPVGFCGSFNFLL